MMRGKAANIFLILPRQDQPDGRGKTWMVWRCKKEIPGDERTAELVAKVANSIYTFVKVEADYQSKHPDKLMPILDLKVGLRTGG